VLEDLYEPVAGLWAARPLRPEVVAAAREPPTGEMRRGPADVIEALSVVRCAVAQTGDVTTAVERAAGASREPALAGALAGALMGAFVGAEAIPQSLTVPLPGLAVIEDFAARLATAGGGAR
jgi:ADP-ribosylglycohydrolase